jgi:tetratricopeptide (TPR) repeat protein
MTFWRREVIDFALDQETRKQMEEQRAWAAREPGNARPYHNLAQFYRMAGKPDEARGLLLEAVRLDPEFAAAHASLAELYAVRGDYRAAWHHARRAERGGDARAVELLKRHQVAEAAEG